MNNNEIKTITLEDGIEYVLVDRINVNEKNYLFLTNIDNEEDFCIRKLIKKDNEEFIAGLDDEKEFDLALLHFTKKHKDQIENN